MADEEIKRLLETVVTQSAAAHAETRRQLETTAAELRRHIEETATGTRRQAEAVAVDLRGQIEETAAETRRYFDVVAERLRSDIQTVAEAVVVTNEKFDRRFDEFEVKVDRNFAETHAMIRFSHADLESRTQ